MKSKNFLFKKSRNLFYRIINPLVKYFGFHLNSSVELLKIKSLIEKLYPVNSGINLIRIGPDSDGGYLIPEDLDGLTALFSPGVDIESRFELELAKRGLKVFLADLSVENPSVIHPNFFFIKKFLGSFNSNYYLTLDSWINNSEIDSSSDLILQMDIEGYEYESIFSISDKNLNRFRIIVIEFHDLNRLIEPYFFCQFSRVIEKLLQNHSVVHIHPNNYFPTIQMGELEVPPIMEFTFLRNDRFYSREKRFDFPHILDKDNVMSKPSVVLPKSWYLSK